MPVIALQCYFWFRHPLGLNLDLNLTRRLILWFHTKEHPCSHSYIDSFLFTFERPGQPGEHCCCDATSPSFGICKCPTYTFEIMWSGPESQGAGLTILTVNTFWPPIIIKGYILPIVFSTWGLTVIIPFINTTSDCTPNFKIWSNLTSRSSYFTQLWKYLFVVKTALNGSKWKKVTKFERVAFRTN